MRKPVVRIAVVLLLAAVVASCAADLALPEGPLGLRYRDKVFSTATVQSDITYGQSINQDGSPETLKFDLYTPNGDTRTGRPMVVWVHGGNYCCGDKTSPEIVDEATTFAKKGYVGASITYRQSDNGCTLGINAECLQAIHDAIADAQAAVRYFRSNAATYGIDPNLIAIAGSSAGAITALGVGYRIAEPETSGTPGVSSEVRSAVSLSGSIFTDEIGAGDAPALLFHGTADPLVAYDTAKATVDAAHKAGLHAYLITWEGEGHVPYTEHRGEILSFTTNFFFNTLGLSTHG